MKRLLRIGRRLSIHYINMDGAYEYSVVTPHYARVAQRLPRERSAAFCGGERTFVLARVIR